MDWNSTTGYRLTRSGRHSVIRCDLNFQGDYRGKPDGSGGLRGAVQGWSRQAGRRFAVRMGRTDYHEVMRRGVVVFGTVTLKRCPASAQEFSGLRRAFLMRAARMGMLDVSWVTEWQGRESERRALGVFGGPDDPGGVPHMHLLMVFDAGRWDARGRRLHRSKRRDWMGDNGTRALVSAWLDVAADFFAVRAAQRVELARSVADVAGYLCKHAMRGSKLRQRSDECRPKAWLDQGSVGRLWGCSKSWPLVEQEHSDLGGDDELRALSRSLLYRAAHEWLERVARQAVADDARIAGVHGDPVVGVEAKLKAVPAVLDWFERMSLWSLHDGMSFLLDAGDDWWGPAVDAARRGEVFLTDGADPIEWGWDAVERGFAVAPRGPVPDFSSTPTGVSSRVLGSADVS